MTDAAQHQPQRALRLRRSRSEQNTTIVLVSDEIQAYAIINQLRNNKTVLSIFNELSSRNRGSEQRFVVTIFVDNSQVKIYMKPTQTRLFEGRVTFACDESLIYRWISKVQDTRVCFYTDRVSEGPASIKARLLLSGCRYYPTKDSPIYL